jgi:hypothetical protein
VRSPWLGLAAILLVVLGLPLAGASHLSVGASDAVGVSPDETPEDPSVPRAWHRVGIQDHDDCHDVDPRISEQTAGNLTQALAEHGFCGKLRYQPGTPLVRTSPSDQDLRGPIGTFDAVFVTYVGTHQLATCLPWCLQGGDAFYRALHDAGRQVGLTPSGDQAPDDSGGFQEYAVNIAVPNPTRIVQDEASPHPMNGWLFPVHDQTIVAFLHDRDQQPIDDRDLATIVAQNDLSDEAVPSVCGFTPDADIQPLNGPSSACEVDFRWIGEDDNLEGGSGSGPCRSPAYVCGGVQEHWQATVTCVAATTRCGAPARDANPTDPEVQTPLLDTGWVSTPTAPDAGIPGDPSNPSNPSPGPGGGPGTWFESSDPPTAADSTTRYLRWHFVVAPAISDCNGIVDPGFHTGAHRPGLPYLAHDLDVFTPVAHADERTRGFTNVRDWTRAFLRDAIGQSEEQTPEIGEAGGPTPLPGEEARRHVAKDWLTEPNAPGDTSKDHVRVDRDNVCTRIQGTGETDETEDPWVDIVDSRVTKTGPNAGPYDNDRGDQSAGNRPGPGLFTTTGMTGVFADPDDDGDYEQAPPSGVFSQIQETGAYPMFWDLWIDEQGDLDEDAGCEMDGEPLTSMMAEADYGPRTGLIQVVLLREGADWYYADEPTSLEHENVAGAGFLVGQGESPGSPAPNAYLFMSQGLWRLHDQGDGRVHDALDEVLDRLPVDDYDLWPSTQMLEPPEEGRSDFHAQCHEGTGGFTSRWSFTHHCLDREPADCTGDTVVTAYLYENRDRKGVLGGSTIPAFEPTGGAYEGFEGSQAGHLWIDVDPLDNDPDRNTNDGSPPTGEG